MSDAERLAFPPALAAKLRATPCEFVITGGSGWIGRATLEMLESALGDDMDRRVAVFGASDRPLQLRSGRILSCRELNRIGEINDKPKLILHFAFLTKDKLSDQSVENFITGNKKISDLIAAAIEQSDARGLFAPSSGAVYKSGTHELDDDRKANAYGVMKIADEKRFTALAAQKNMPLCMPRLYNLSGPFINKHALYALASMIKAVLEDKPITIRAAHKVIRSYIHVADLVTLAFSMLLEPKPDDQAIFDTAGDDVLELGDLTDYVRKALGHPDHPIQRPERVEGRDDIYVGDGQNMQRMLQNRGLALRDIICQIRDTADYLRSVQ